MFIKYLKIASILFTVILLSACIIGGGDNISYRYSTSYGIAKIDKLSIKNDQKLFSFTWSSISDENNTSQAKDKYLLNLTKNIEFHNGSEILLERLSQYIQRGSCTPQFSGTDYIYLFPCKPPFIKAGSFDYPKSLKYTTFVIPDKSKNTLVISLQSDSEPAIDLSEYKITFKSKNEFSFIKTALIKCSNYHSQLYFDKPLKTNGQYCYSISDSNHFMDFTLTKNSKAAIFIELQYNSPNILELTPSSFSDFKLVPSKRPNP